MEIKKLFGFGVGLFCMLLVLAMVYSQYRVRDDGPGAPVGVQTQVVPQPEPVAEPSMTAMPVPETVTPEIATTNLIDEAMADRDDVSMYADDEITDAEAGGE